MSKEKEKEKKPQGRGTRARQEFVSEAEEVIEKIFQNLIVLEDGSRSGEVNPDTLNEIFRGAHSLKGIAGMFGLDGVSSLSHSLEDLLDRLRMGKVELSPELLEHLYQGMNTLKALVDGIGKGQEEDKLAAEKMVARINQLLRTQGSAAAASPFASVGLDPAVFKSLTEYEEHRLAENVRKGIPLFRIHTVFPITTFDQDLTGVNQDLKKVGEIITTLPSSQPGREDEIVFDLIVGCQKGIESITGAVGSRAGVTVELIPAGGKTEAPAPVPAAETAPEEPAEARPRESEGTEESLKSVSQTVRVDIGKLDRIIAIVGELVLSQAEIGRLAEFLRGQKGLEEPARELLRANRILERKVSELQQSIMEARMVPLRQLFERLARVVRQTCRDGHKEVDLEIYGADTELDKLIVEELGDPLMHIIRNSLDHGIEPLAEREKAGKTPRGRITLNAFSVGSHVVVEVEDDGRGINWKRVKEKARELKLLDPAIEPSPEDAASLLFLPGFSTSEKVTSLSGRGVGLDVVKRNITRISGMIELDSEAGVGTRFQITLPITLAIIRVLLVEISGKVYAIPLTSIQENLAINLQDIRTVEGKEVIQLRDKTLPLIRLERLFRLEPRVLPSENGNRLYVVVVGMAERRIGLLAGNLLGQQDVVIKPLGKLADIVPGIAGAADLGSHKTILILDVGALIEESTRAGSPSAGK
ncbi:MAG: chemotaxis protein CheA [Proteobacteria bacterium]|nr:chemotaxis protein CheA [Pseudomonadota bacterium]